MAFLTARMAIVPSARRIVCAFVLATATEACRANPTDAPPADAAASSDSTLSDAFAVTSTEGRPDAVVPPAVGGGQDASSDSAPVPVHDGPPSDSGAPVDAPDADAGAVLLPRNGTPVSAFAYGQNYWAWVDWSHNGVTGLSGTEALVSALRLNVLRAGGINNDDNSPQPFDPTQIDKYVAYCRATGAEPILQVPIVANSVDGGATSAQTAADMVTYANVTKGYAIQYWEIGNEPDNYDTVYDAGVPLTAAQYCATFAAYAAAMRTANAAAAGARPLRLVGPDLAWKYVPGHDWLTPFLDACKNDVDVVSIHRYPFSAAQLTVAAALADNEKFRSDLTALRAIVQGHARPGTPLAVTEANVSYDYAPAKFVDAAVPAEPGTFNAALWTADALGVALENGLWSFALWNLGERSGGSVLGFIVNGQPTPQYYALKLFSANLRGDVVAPTGVPAGFSVYASRDVAAATTAAVVVNKTSSRGTLALALEGARPQAFDFPASSISLVQIPDIGGPIHITQYTRTMAAAGVAPVQVQ